MIRMVSLVTFDVATYSWSSDGLREPALGDNSSV